jgi:Tfp pilus assembly protein PilV
MTKPARHRTGMTLIELVVSALLTAIMMVVLTNILWSANRESRALMQTESAGASPKILIDTLRRDLINARGMTQGNGVLTLAGFLGPGQTFGATTYTTTVSGNRSTLRRNGQLMWMDVGVFSITPLSFHDADDSRPPLDGNGGLPEMPSIIQVTLTHADGGLLWSERIHHHDL